MWGSSSRTWTASPSSSAFARSTASCEPVAWPRFCNSSLRRGRRPFLLPRRRVRPSRRNPLPGSKARLRRVSLAEAVERGRATYAEWGGGLSLEQFLERERRFRRSEWAKEAISTWFLEDSSGRCLSSCETFRVGSSFNGKKGVSAGIASVYTEPAFRGKGSARE